MSERGGARLPIGGMAKAPNVAASSVLDAIFSTLKALNDRLYQSTARNVRAIGISLDDDPFDRAALMWADRKKLSAEEIIEAGYFDGEWEGCAFRITRWTAIK